MLEDVSSHQAMVDSISEKSSQLQDPTVGMATLQAGQDYEKLASIAKVGFGYHQTLHIAVYNIRPTFIIHSFYNYFICLK